MFWLTPHTRGLRHELKDGAGFAGFSVNPWLVPWAILCCPLLGLIPPTHV